MKKIFLAVVSVLLLFATSATAWDGSVASEFAGGDGSASSPYQIATAEQLALLAKYVNSDDVRYSGEHFKLTGNIDISGHQWTPIGIGDRQMVVNKQWQPDAENYFAGSFDGAGHTISGLTIASDNYDVWNGTNAAVQHHYVGLFGAVRDGEIKDVRLEGASIRVAKSGPEVPVVYAGTLAAYTSGKVSGSSASGRLELDVDIPKPSAQKTNDAYAGGLIGAIASDDASIKGCSTSVEVICSGYFQAIAGGIAAWVDGAELVDCTSYGSVTSSAVRSANGSVDAGGLVGFMTGSKTGKSNITRGRAHGSVSADARNHARAGGIVATYGPGRGDAKISRSFSTGSVVASSKLTDAYAGGIAASSHGKIAGCWSLGGVSAICDEDSAYAAFAGGIAGYAYRSTSDETIGDIEGSFALGAIRSALSEYINTTDNYRSHAGGIVGAVSNANIFDSYASGSVKAEGPAKWSCAGGIVGQIEGITSGNASTISHCWYSGASVSSGANGGIIGVSATDNSALTLVDDGKPKAVACVWADDTDGASSGVGVDLNEKNSTGPISADEMIAADLAAFKNPSTFDGWDMTGTWLFTAADGRSAPRLASFVSSAGDVSDDMTAIVPPAITIRPGDPQKIARIYACGFEKNAQTTISFSQEDIGGATVKPSAIDQSVISVSANGTTTDADFTADISCSIAGASRPNRVALKVTVIGTSVGQTSVAAVRPILKDKPANVDANEPTTFGAASRDVLAEKTGFDEADFALDAAGYVTLSETVAREHAISALGEENVGERVVPFPVFRSEVKATGRVAAVGFEVDEDMVARGASVVKILPDGAAIFERASSSAEYADGKYDVLEGDDGKAVLVIFVADGGKYDLDDDPAVVLDPFAIVEMEVSSSDGSSSDGSSSDSSSSNSSSSARSSGSCSASGAAIAALALMVMVRRRRCEER